MNSSLVEYTKYSPNNSGKRNHTIDRITPHCVVGQITGPSLGAWFAKESTQASSNYGIDKDGRVCLFVDEDCRAWTSSSSANDNRAVTIECASDQTAPYAFNDVVYNQLIALCVDICKRNGKNTLIWIPDKNTALNYAQKSGEMLLTVHRWFSDTSCPGEWLMSRLADLAARVTAQLQKHTTPTETKPADNDNPQEAFINLIAAACQAQQKARGVLASVSIAQAILESGWGKSELARQANNLFGMKLTLSGVKWPGGVYRKETQEWSASKGTYTITADFRAYNSIIDSIEDHAEYLATARNGNGLRYAGIVGETDPAKVCDILTKGGYATSPDYKASLLDIVNRYNLTRFDDVKEETPDRLDGAVVIPIQKTFEQVQKGDECQSVWILRTMLRGRDYKNPAGKRLTRSKRFDADTDYAVKNFQKKAGLVVDGIAGPKTWRKLLGV